MKDTVKIGLIGFGTVGTGAAKILFGAKKPHLRGLNFDIELVKIADIDITTDRGIDLPENILTIDANEILNGPEIDIVIELIGGYEPAREFTLRAFENKKSVVTANKALVAKHGSELFSAAARANVSYLFEASVGGGIPILRGIAEGLNANEILSIYGILNGTTNYILTRMARDGLGYEDMLKRAQELGYAEADPTSDISGGDALNKIVILARLAFNAELDIGGVYCEGIENVTTRDIEYAGELGYAVKLLAIAKKHDDGLIEARVHPTLVPSDSVMASVEDEFNAVEIYGDAVGREIFYGKGAGMMPTASAVVSDVMDIAKGIQTGAQSNVNQIVAQGDSPGQVDFENLTMRYYLRFTIKDRPGVLAGISRVLADENISIQSVIQKGTAGGDHVPLVIMTHEAREGDMQRAMQKFEQFKTVRGKVQLIRVEDV